MIPADLGAELSRAIGAAVAAGDLPPDAAWATAAGTWRPAPGNDPASYATSLPFRLSRHDPRAAAETLASALRSAPGIAAARPTGNGYLTITVTPAALTSLAVRIPAAGPACARSDALRGETMSAPPLPGLSDSPGWRQAWHAQALALTGQLAIAAGAIVMKKLTLRAPSAAMEPGPRSVASAVDYAGSDAVRYGLSRILSSRATEADRGARVSYRLDDPWYAVSFAHAEAGSVQRWAVDLGLRRGDPGELAGSLAGLLAEPAELALLGRLSWLAERVAGAARRRRPAELPRYLESVAAAWLDCRESCPALPFGGAAAPRDEAGISARLWLAAATRTVLAAGLELIGIRPRDRL